MKLDSVGILSMGEMGSAIATVLGKHGLKVQTCLEGRSKRTQQMAAATGARALPTLEDVVAASDIIISVVIPSAAVALASSVADAIAKIKTRVLFADVNAISPSTSAQIGKIISVAGGRYVDGCINGPASKLEKGSTMYVSGQHCSDFVLLQRFGLTIKVLGDKIGQASAFKMVYAGLNKGLSSLAVELLLTAHSLGIFDQTMESYRSEYPDMVRFLESVIPRLPFRAGRRSEEMEELSHMMEQAGVVPIMAPASGRMLRSIGDLKLRSEYSDSDEAGWEYKEVIKILHARLTKPTDRSKR